MNVNSINNNNYNKINFKSGLSKKILDMEHNANIGEIKNFFWDYTYRDWRDFSYNLNFKDNKAYAVASKLAAEIFIKFQKKHDYRKGYSQQKLVFPRGIYVYNENELSDKFKSGLDENVQFLTLYSSNKEVIKEKKFFDYFTILMKNNYDSLEAINERMEQNKKDKFLSSGHFLHQFIHEFIHAIQAKLVYNRNCDEYERTMNNYLNKRLNKKENEIVADVLGEYASWQRQNHPQYPEIFAEAWTKCICDSLDENCNLVDDPVEKMKKMPEEFQNILNEVSKIEFYRRKNQRK